MKKLLSLSVAFIFIVLAASTLLHAEVTSHYCSTGAAYVDIGSTQQAVEAACGKLRTEAKVHRNITEEHPIEQWFYHYQDPIITAPGEDEVVELTFAKGKLARIRVDTLEVTHSNFCPNGGYARLGQTQSDVRSTCGSPLRVIRGTQTLTSGKKQTHIWTYENSKFEPKTVFEFQDGKLTRIQHKAK